MKFCRMPATSQPPRKGLLNERSSLAQFSDTTTAKTKGQQIALDLRRTIHHFFPDLSKRLSTRVSAATIR